MKIQKMKLIIVDMLEQLITPRIDNIVIKQRKLFALDGLSEPQIDKAIFAAVELSAVTGWSIEESANTIRKTFQGNIRQLGKFDKRFRSFTNEELKNGYAVDLINKKFSGYAKAIWPQLKINYKP